MCTGGYPYAGRTLTMKAPASYQRFPGYLSGGAGSSTLSSFMDGDGNAETNDQNSADIGRAPHQYPSPGALFTKALGDAGYRNNRDGAFPSATPLPARRW